MPKSKNQIPDIRRKLRRFSRTANRVTQEHVRAFATRHSAEFKLSIERQSFQSFTEFPLSDAYRKVKEHKGLDPRVMIRIGHYTNKIRVMERIEDGQLRIVIGFAPTDRAVDSEGVLINLPLSVLSAIHEHGSISAGIPARPHWGPYLQRMKLDAKKERKKIAIDVVSTYRKGAA